MQCQTKDKGTYNDLQNITQKTKDWATRSPQENIENTLLILLLFFRPFGDVESATGFFLLYIENHGYNMKEYFDT
jgi:hypothetical protein